ncbi:hypothetical protein A0H81_00991 [Grifola frondosa]|uniref:F-box domain-containing protein n=1 Tax=Grifola frondosa TaxID=5627 RepID=A0A1C7MTJ9_GRIFR|nr:hypothetical protein A0H81_00991 [Grifola frondosa]
MLTFQVETHVHDLCSLPTELIIKLLDELDFRSLLLCRQVCRFFQTIIDEDAALQYKIELAVAGMEDGPPSARSPAERLAKLKARQAAWNSLQPSSQKTIPMLRGEVWELYGGVLAQARGPQSLAFRQLPSDIRGIEEKEWMIEDVGIAIRDFGMDPAQDLLVVIETPLGRIVNTHLLELSTGRRHPIASKSVLSYRPAGSHSFAIQISGDFLGVFFISGDESESELLIWNWKTGDRELCVYSCDGAEVASFAFLSDRHVLIVGVNLPDAPLEDQQQPGLVLFVIDFLKTPADTQDIKDVDFLCTFHYPTLSPLATPLAMTVRSDPAPSWKPHHDLLVPFYTSREDRLIVVTLWVADRLVVRSLLLLVPSSILLSRVNSLAPGEFKRHFPWEEWGPQVLV